MKKIILVFFILSLFTVVSKAQRKPHSIPKPTPKVTVSPKTEGLDLGIVIEKYVSNIEINSAGNATEVFEISRKHTTAFAINRFKVDSVEFNSDTNEIEVLEAYKITAEGKKIIIPASKIKIKPTPQTEAAPGFSSLKILEIDFDGLKLGDTTYTKAVIRDKKKNFEGKFSKVVFFPTIYEYKNAEINIKAPLGFPIKFEAIEVEGGKLPDEKDYSQWQWKKINTKAEKFVVGMENLLDSSPRLAVSSFADYQELAKMYWSEAKQKSIVTPQIQKLADEITNGIADPKAQANAIYEWVNKNIRYLSVVLERGGWVPHSADSIIKNGYGDCKDYTTLLQALLGAKGIESRHILIRSDQVNWFPKVATPETFDHVILYIPTLDLYADATAPNTRLGLISSVMRGKDALLVGEKSELIKVSEDKAEENQFLSETELEFTGNGGIKSRSTNTYIGQPEMLFRPLFADSALLTNSETFVELLLTYYGVNGTGKILNISDSHKVGEPFNT